MKHLYLIGGPMGVGKTAVCRQLQQLLPNSVFLDGDWCWDMQPRTVNAETKAMVLDNITHVLNNFLACSTFEHVIFCWVLHQESIWAQLLAALHTQGVQVHAVALHCDAATLQQRLQRDIDQGVRQADILARSLSDLPLYAQLPPTILHLDTTALDARQCACALLQATLGVDSRCGLCCTTCSFRAPLHCPGCLQSDGHPFHGECPVAQCSLKKGYLYCGQCTQFPCALLQDFSNDPEHGDTPCGARITQCRHWQQHLQGE